MEGLEQALMDGRTGRKRKSLASDFDSVTPVKGRAMEPNKCRREGSGFRRVAEAVPRESAARVRLCRGCLFDRLAI